LLTKENSGDFLHTKKDNRTTKETSIKQERLR